eukprot:TRINITY_DN5257_c0_g1_i3.p2 TRINITY_DN5257_c0_g1~~TRINITY_DN5257_c0_g1_i3.p2  ORF type:complete len:210 (-),score=22.74 TRINITY_DN5257_c0_g1_i3:88-717(-)
MCYFCLDLRMLRQYFLLSYFFFNVPATTEIYTILFVGSVRCVQETGTWGLYKRTEDPLHPYQLFCLNTSHSRIIWTLSFSNDTKYCLTGSRDKKLKIWKLNENDCQLSIQQNFTTSVTAACFDRNSFAKDQQYLVAIGIENGAIFIYQFNSASNEFLQLHELHKYLSPCSIISRLEFALAKKENNEICSKLAVGAYDGSLRIFMAKQNV